MSALRASFGDRVISIAAVLNWLHAWANRFTAMKRLTVTQ